MNRALGEEESAETRSADLEESSEARFDNTTRYGGMEFLNEDLGFLKWNWIGLELSDAIFFEEIEECEGVSEFWLV